MPEGRFFTHERISEEVALHIMGWSRNVAQDGSVVWLDLAGNPSVVPAYAHDIEAAKEVRGKMRDLGWEIDSNPFQRVLQVKRIGEKVAQGIGIEQQEDVPFFTCVLALQALGFQHSDVKADPMF